MANEANEPNRAFRDNMTMIAVVKDGDRLLDNAQVSVYCGTELRGLSTEAVRNGRHFLTIGGNGGQDDLLTFVITTPEGDFLATATSADTTERSCPHAGFPRGSQRASPAALSISCHLHADGKLNCPQDLSRQERPRKRTDRLIEGKEANG